VKNLLVPVDFSDVTDRVITAAEQVARAFGSKVWLMHCVGEYPAFAAMGEIPAFLPVPNAALPESYPDQYRKLSELTASLSGKGIEAGSLFVGGMAIEEILSVADEHQIDMIVMGSHGHGAWYELLVGTVTEGVLHRAGRPVLIVPSEKKSAAAKSSERREVPAATP
jgi:nucleotide-binding universal stress UspA family protein